MYDQLSTTEQRDFLKLNSHCRDNDETIVNKVMMDIAYKNKSKLNDQNTVYSGLNHTSMAE